MIVIPSDPRRIVGQNVRARRHALGLTQVELGDRTQIQQGHVSAIERGQSAPSLELLLALASALEVPPGALVSAGDLGVRSREVRTGLCALSNAVASG